LLTLSGTRAAYSLASRKTSSGRNNSRIPP
jgi:hypothetical protein